VIRFRVRQVAARMRTRFDERMAERERIARELHDTLLQGTQALVLKVDAAARLTRDGEPAHEMLAEALARADRVMTEGRDRIQDLRIPTDVNGELSTSIAAVGEELAQGRATTFRVVVEGATRRLRVAAKDEAYAIGREALLNAFRHADAKSIEVQIIYAEADLRIRIRDDGIGIDPDTLEVGSRPDHWGLQGMRERAARIGAQVEIWSRPGAGTEIELKIPAATAYAERPVRSRWRPLRFMVGDEG
jgi:signal transduction histidine kinase